MSTPSRILPDYIVGAIYVRLYSGCSNSNTPGPGASITVIFDVCSRPQDQSTGIPTFEHLKIDCRSTGVSTGVSLHPSLCNCLNLRMLEAK